MYELFKIFAQQMKDGDEEKIVADIPPDFMEIHEAELVFEMPITISGKAYRLNNDLVLQLSIKTSATMPCAICNHNVQIGVSIPNFCHTEPIGTLKSGIFNFREPLREAILLEIPMIVECHNGQCPERETLKKFLKPNY